MSPVSNRLDWVAIWERFDSHTPDVGLSPSGERLAYYVSSRARLEIQEIVESALADREAALS